MLGSPSIKEGVSLLRVQQVHMMEPYWNMSRMLQIMGRAVRFCSHKDVPKNKRIVKIYLYLASYPGEKTIDPKKAPLRCWLLKLKARPLRRSSGGCIDRWLMS